MRKKEGGSIMDLKNCVFYLGKSSLLFLANYLINDGDR